MQRFVLVGAAGYIAPRHLKAIKDTGHNLVAAYDISDSVGILDSYFPDANFFTRFEQFAGFVQDEHLNSRKIDYMVVCTPNHLHLSHIKFALSMDINVICEKPLVLSCADLNSLRNIEERCNANVYSILQLRLHPAILSLKRKVEEEDKLGLYDVELTYLTARGKWYIESWKGDEAKSGGVATNIGIHFFDMLGFVFGDLRKNELHFKDDKTLSGCLEFEKARVRWFLSIDPSHLPENAIHGEKVTYRSITVDGVEVEFSGGFTELHTESYRKILAGNGYSIMENHSATSIVEDVRKIVPCSEGHNMHPLAKKIFKSKRASKQEAFS